MLSINMDDVLSVISSVSEYLIAIGIVLAAAIVLTIVYKWVFKKKPARKLARKTTWLTAFLAVVVIINLICFIPMKTMISLATGSGSIDEATSEEAEALVEDIAEEGIVLLKNDDDILPLASGSSLNVFGWASTNPCYGGTGSGSLSDTYESVSLLEGIENAGFSLNSELSDMYTAYCSDRPTLGMWSNDWTLPEPTADYYTDDLLSAAQEFSDTALVVITRVGGEGADLPTDVSEVTYTNNSSEYDDFEEGEHYLQLSQTEKNMLEVVTSNFDNVIVVYNGANPIELGFVNDYDQIKGVIWCAGTGQNGFNALGRILSGDVNPSGKTVDTFVADLTATPTWNNFGSFIYDNMETDEYVYTSSYFRTTSYPSFVNYVEGIYVGYKFYETAAEEGLIDYDSTVVYPFGYGLSYTTFSQEMGDVTYSDGTISFDVTVTNTGSVAGKDVVEVYYNPPYENGGIEKASANLIAFEKTDLLAAGESQTITISFADEDMASFDSYGSGCYVLEAGDYVISINSDSHTILESATVTVDSDIVYDESNKRSSDETAALNVFAYAEGDGSITYLSREDGFANYDEATAAPSSLTASDYVLENFVCNNNYDVTEDNDDSDVMPTTGASNGLTLADMKGLDYDDESWDTLLDQLTVSDMDTLIALGGYETSAASSVGKVLTYDCDGPASINNNFTGVGSVGFPSATMIAATWNKELALEFGESIGKMADEMDVSGWYAPAMNTHRTAFAGRNFEYYSEDGVLSGYMAANAVAGAKEYGVYSYIKHFALNDQETNRTSMLCTWSTEQAIREIYLKPFEIAVKEGGAQAVMSGFNYIGYRWCGASSSLLNDVLRDEWGFEGFVLTDYFGVNGYMDSDIAIRNGNDCMLVNYDTATNHLDDTSSATAIKDARQACKNIMYTVVNSRAYYDENLNAGLPTWEIAAIVINVILGALIVLLEYLAVRKYLKERKKAA